MINVQEIHLLQSANIKNWHDNVILTQVELPWKFIEENNMWNFLLWHEEDLARIIEIDPFEIVKAKRNIDRYNQARNNSIEDIDQWILNYLVTNGVNSQGALHSETPGMMIDRLSIMQLKIFHMEEETTRLNATEDHSLQCKKKVLILNEQIQDLSDCLPAVLKLISSGGLKFKIYRQFKMYNDPSLNPQLYNRKQ